MRPARTSITFLGTSALIPTAGHDSASFIINRKYLVDTGWYAAIKMLSYGFDPLDLEYLLVTHWHGDHFLGLPQLLLYLRTSQRSKKQERVFNIIGPSDHLESVVTQALLFPHRGVPLPKLDIELNLFPLKPGESYEDSDFHVSTCPCVHTIEGLVYKFTDKSTGATLGFTGDTAPDPKIAEHLKRVMLLIHDATHGPNDPPDPRIKGGLHSSAVEAARIARDAEARRLALIHGPHRNQQAAVEAAQKIFPNTFWPKDGETVDIP